MKWHAIDLLKLSLLFTNDAATWAIAMMFVTCELCLIKLYNVVTMRLKCAFVAIF